MMNEQILIFHFRRVEALDGERWRDESRYKF
jgi:hypothetical protein